MLRFDLGRKKSAGEKRGDSFLGSATPIPQYPKGRGPTVPNIFFDSYAQRLVVWLGGRVVRTLDLRARGREFRVYFKRGFQPKYGVQNEKCGVQD